MSAHVTVPKPTHCYCGASDLRGSRCEPCRDWYREVDRWIDCLAATAMAEAGLRHGTFYSDGPECTSHATFSKAIELI